MLRAPLSPACLVVLIATIVLAGTARAQSVATFDSVHEMALPGGLQQVLATTGESVVPDRSQFLVDFIRRTYNRPLTPRNRGRDATLQSLLAGLDASNGSNGSAAGPVETLPLPLPAAVWIDAVFGGRETPETLVSALLRSRGPALLYYGLLSLDDATREWLVTEPQLIAELADQLPAAFVMAAPGLRVRGTALDVPGGEAAVPAWEALVGRGVGAAAGFTRALLRQDDGRLAFFFGTMAQLTPGQLRVALRLDSPDAAIRVAAARRLRAVFERITPGWRVDDRVFWRPALDPALLVASLRTDSAGLPVVPGTRQFWSAILVDRNRDMAPPGGEAGRAAFVEDAADFTWLCEQIFTGNQDEDRRRYNLVLFVSRLAARSAHWSAAEAIVPLRAAHTLPALISSLERAKLVDVAAFAAAARRAEAMSAIPDSERRPRALAQFQGTLALVTRAASRGGLRPEALASIISSVSAIELSGRGDYEGRLVRWLTEWLAAHVHGAPGPLELDDFPAAGPMERDAIAALAGSPDVEPRFVDWEGTRYRLDFARAERLRLTRLLGEQSRPFLSSARALVAMADAIREELTDERLRQHAGAFDEIATAVGWTRAGEWDERVRRRFRGVVAELQPAARASDLRSASRLTPALLELADDLLARGLMELAYAVALGHKDLRAISPDEVARRHYFGPKVQAGRRFTAWELPSPDAVPGRWRVTGSLLGLDVRLADFALLRLSSRPPSRTPTLAGDHRRVLVETVALVDAASLTDQDRATIVSAIRKGRARLAAARTPKDAVALAEEIRLSPARRTLLSWAMAHDRERVPAFLSPSELLWLGLEKAPVPGGLHAWGVSAWPRTGCVCLGVLDRQPWETLAGRWHSGALASGFPDLNLRLAELLDELHMPASLLAPVLASATLDLVDSAAARDPDDRRALLEFVQALRLDRVEQYLALLTADGPLVPVNSGGTQ